MPEVIYRASFPFHASGFPLTDCGNDNTCVIIYDALYNSRGNHYHNKLKNTGTEISEPAEIIAYMNTCFLHDCNF
jgi:hypothetical protein